MRKINGEWYNFNSLYPAPEHLSRFYLSAYLDSLKGSGWSIFIVRGNFPKECPIPASDANNGFGQWLTPDDAKRISVSCNQLQAPTAGESSSQPMISSPAEADAIEEQEERDLRAAIAASLMDFPSFDTTKNDDGDAGSSTAKSSSDPAGNDDTVRLDADPNEAVEGKDEKLAS
ncbi:hypothetical protein KSP39_PZI013450 [Platanthera zijinensis]|uniref:ubiquitinyl hydrolase 1 n=1 Tax=Platanthera zijinensis TaxID=2320716 RepID=A0AAP0BBC3_9ASPA